MNIRQKPVLIPAAFAAGSFLFIVTFASLTSPLNKIAYAIVFFAAFLIFLVSVGYLMVRAQGGGVSPRSRYRIWIISLLILITVMLRSAQSFNLIDMIIIFLIAFGLVFYSSQRG